MLGKESSHSHLLTTCSITAALQSRRAKAHGRHSPPAHGVLLQRSPGRPTNDTQNRDRPDRPLRRTRGPPAARRRALMYRRLLRGGSASSQHGTPASLHPPYIGAIPPAPRTPHREPQRPSRPAAAGSPVAAATPPAAPRTAAEPRSPPRRPAKMAAKGGGGALPAGMSPPRPPAAGCPLQRPSAKTTSWPGSVRAPNAPSFAVPRSVPTSLSCFGRRFGDGSRHPLRAGTY